VGIAIRTAASLAIVGNLAALSATPAEAQFRRGLFSESTEITLYPLDVPALLLPAGNVQIEARNASTASARILERLQDLLSRQLTDNDSRLSVVPKGADTVVTVTLIDWKESRRSSTKYVSEKRQVGTRRVTEKNGTVKIEPVYEYGRNKPSVVIDAAAGLRVEVRRGRGAPLADETVRHTIREEHLTEEGPPSRDAIEDQLIDQVVQKGAGRVSPGRWPTRVLVARSDDVDRLNDLAQARRWQDWLTALGAVKPHSDRKRDSYRLHNLAVAHEAIAYEATTAEDWAARLTLAGTLIKQASTQNANEKYITESADRITASATRYRRLAEMYREVGAAATPRRTTAAPSSSGAPTATTAAPISAATGAASPRSALMTNQEVIDLVAAGLDDDNLLAAIKDAKSVKFDLSPAGLKTLLSGKVSNRVITAMRARAK
jgi:hypothetical protein